MKRLTQQDVIEFVRLSLGEPVITLYIEDIHIIKMMKSAVMRVSSRVGCTSLLSLYINGGVVDLSGKGVETVMKIYGGYSNYGIGEACGCGCSTCSSNPKGAGALGFQGCNVCQYQWLRGGTFDLMSLNSPAYDYMAYNLALSEIRKYNISDFYWDAESEQLLVDGFSGNCTIEYVKKEAEIEDIDGEWQDWVLQYTLALSKIIEGRIRGKYKLSGAPFEIESDELISEGNSDKQELESKLSENMGYWNIMR